MGPAAAAAARLRADPEAQARFLATIQQLQTELLRIATEDRASARSREVELARAGQRDWMPAVLVAIEATMVFGGLATLIGCFLGGFTLPQELVAIVAMAVGEGRQQLGTAVGYYLGTSATEAARQEK